MDPEKKKQLQRYGIAAGVVLLLLLGAFSAGRFSAPLKVETRDVERVVYKDKIVTVEKVVEKVVTVEKEAKVETKIVWRDRVITKDGTVTEHIVEKTGRTDEATKTTTDAKDKVSTVDATHALESTHETVKTVTLRPSWRVSLQVGASLKDPLLPIAGPLVLGASGEYRIVGGLSAGVWVNTFGAAGAVVSMEF